MKKLTLLLLILLSTTLQAGITMVSDLDDTIKITNSGREVDGAINALFSNDVFTAIPEFLEAARLYVDEIHVLSASPTILRSKINKTFKKKGITVDSLILRNILQGESKLAYKVKHIKQLMEQNPADDFILVGDDVGQDPEVFDEIRRAYPRRVLAAYVHVINGRDLPKSVTSYWTSYDLFLREYVAGRMPESWVRTAVEKTLNETKMKYIFPDFAKCPLTPEVWFWQLRTSFRRQSIEIAKRLNGYCLANWSGISLP